MPVAALKKAPLRVRINVYDLITIELLSCLQNVQDAFGGWEWQDRLNAIASSSARGVQHQAESATSAVLLLAGLPAH
jgi:hypothetical protein